MGRVEWWKTMKQSPQTTQALPAGTVEAGEFVFNKQAVQALGSQNLDKLHKQANKGEVTSENFQGLPSFRCGGKVKSYQPGGLVTPTEFGAKKKPLQDPKGFTSPGFTSQQAPLSASNVGLGPGGGESFGLSQLGLQTTKPAPTNLSSVDINAARMSGFVPTQEEEARVAAQMRGQIPTVQMPGLGAVGETFGATGEIAPTLPVTGEGFEAFTGELAPTGTLPADTTKLPSTQVQEDIIPSREERARILGLGGLADVAAGESQIFRTLANVAQQQIAAQGTVDETALRQEMAQLGITGGAANAMMAGLTRDISSQQAQAAATTAIAAQKMSADALRELSAQGLQGMVFEEGKRRFDIGVQQDAMDATLAAGDIDSYVNMFENVHGIRLDASVLENTQNRILLQQGSNDAQALFLSDPGISIDDTRMQAALNSIWQGTGGEGDMTPEFAERTYASIKRGADPLFRAANSITLEGANEFFGEENVTDFSYTDAFGDTLTGWDGMKKAFGDASITGGFKVDPVTGEFVFDFTNPIVQTLLGQTGQVDFANIDIFTDASTEVGTKVTFGGQEYERIGTGPVDWQRVTEPPEPEIPTTFTTIRGVQNIISSGQSPTGEMTEDGVFITRDAENKPIEYTYELYKKDNQNKLGNLDQNLVITYANQGDENALNDIDTLIRGKTNIEDQFEILRELNKGDAIFDQVFENSNNLEDTTIKDNAFTNDQLKNPPSVGDIVQVGDQLVRITFVGHLDVAGPSDDAHIEYINLSTGEPFWWGTKGSGKGFKVGKF